MRFIRLFQWPALLLFSLSTNAEIQLSDLEAISTADTMVMVPMRDGVRLATDI